LSSPKLLARASVIFAAVALVAILLAAFVGIPALIVALVCAVAGAILSGLAYRTPTERASALVGLVPSVTEVVVVILVLLLVTPTSVHRS
jgi:hypothetical protein